LDCMRDGLGQMSNNVEFCPRIPIWLGSFPSLTRLATD
jgi:hypothetical protein